MTKKVKRISVITLSAVLCVAIIAGILAWAAGNKNNNLTAEVIPVMNIASSYWDNDTSYGYVQSGYSQRIMASTEQQIQEFFVEEGDAVEIGDPILSYDPTAIQLEVERQELNLDSMEVRMDRLYRELNELKNTKPSDASGLSVVFVSGEGSSEESHTSVGEDSTQPEESFGEESAAEEDSSMPQESSSEVSSEEDCFLFRLNLTGLTLPIISLLESPSVTKVGLSLRDDFMMLHKRAPFEQHSCIELQEYVRMFGIQDKSLQKIYGILFGEKISKSQRLSNWEAEHLTEPQKQYAATDAWACLNIYNRLQELKVTGDYELEPDEPLTNQESLITNP